MSKFYYNSPIGILEITTEKDTIKTMKMVSEKGISDFNNDNKIIQKQLDEYFNNKRTAFSLKIAPSGTNFQKQVWEKIIKIPYGKTKTYGEIAEEIGNKNAQRAVGSACNKNPIFIVIPCHRVIAKNKKIGGYAYGTEIKEKLLKLENKKILNFVNDIM